MKKPKLYKPNRVKGGKKFTFNKTGRSKGYDRDWDIYRFRFLHHNPNCYCCGQKATVVDHIKAHKGDNNLFKNLKNHMQMCTSCHNYVTGKFDRNNPPLTDEKFQWIAAKREELNISIKIKVLAYYGKKK